MEGQTVSASVVGGATAGHEDAQSLSSTPGVSGGASTKSGCAIMVVWALGGDVVTSVGCGAPRGAGQESQALATVVANGAARRDGDASSLADAPALSGRAQALEGGAVVVAGTIGGDVVARVGDGTPASSGIEGQAVSAVVVGGATRRNSDASEFTSAPSVSSGAQAFSG